MFVPLKLLQIGPMPLDPMPERRPVRRWAEPVRRAAAASVSAAAEGDTVDYTVFAPPEAAAGDAASVQVFAHLPDATAGSRRSSSGRASRRR